MDPELTLILTSVGLKAQEARLYLTCLKWGTQDLPTLASQAQLSRYDTLTALHLLCERGFLTKFVHGKEFFTAELPDVMLRVLEETQLYDRTTLNNFRKALPFFEKYRNPHSTRPEISFYEGKQGIMVAYEDTLTSRTDILAIASIQDTETSFPHYVPRYYQRRKAAGILIKAIFPDTKAARVRQAKDEQELRVSRLIPAGNYPFTNEINIYDDKVAYFSLKEELAVIIKSADIAHNMATMFALCWELAEQHQRKLRKSRL
jgi:sugar-specific transcriptional regulator TrmB